MKATYPIFIKKDKDVYLVYIPDFNGYTEGTDLFDAIRMARDYISLTGVNTEDDGLEDSIPGPSSVEEAVEAAKADADEDMDFSDGILTLVDVDFDAYRKALNHRAVKKNCSIPYWMSVEADKRHINYSKVLQEALENIIESPHTMYS